MNLFASPGPVRLHLVGVGGAGMSGLARILLQRGHHVSGSDLKDGRGLDELRALGATISIGHRRDAVGDVAAVVASTAVGARNPELQAAAERGIPVLSRAQLLAALMELDRRILVAGTHGKTTTTSMTVVALQAAGGDPSFAIGGQLNEAGTNAHAGTDGRFVAEADESDRSLLAYAADVAVVTNAELDHPDEFRDDADVQEIFRSFLANCRPGATAILCGDDPGSAALAAHAPGQVMTYGEAPGSDMRLLVEGHGRGRVRFDGRDLASLHLQVPGRHNLLNATAALSVCMVEGVDLEAAADGLAGFTGTARRFQVLGQVAGVTVVDDYAHHPTELRATLAAARAREPERLVVVVQPHRYSRTRVLGAELGRAAAAAEIVVVTEVFAAGEAAEPGVSGHLVADAAQDAGARVLWEPHLSDVVETLRGVVRPGDLVLVTGAGDVTQVGPALLQALEAGGG
jgi:UDP-N-acetylmuramate--alanine ligase